MSEHQSAPTSGPSAIIAPKETDPEARIRAYNDLEDYLIVSHPENVVVTRYGREVVDVLENDESYLRTETDEGWLKWVLKDSFLRQARRSSPSPIKIVNFLERYGEAALRAVREDTKGFTVDDESGTIQPIQIDKRVELRKIIEHHYRTALATGHPFELEIEEDPRSRKIVRVTMFVVDRDAGLFIGTRRFRLKALTLRILTEIGVKADIIIVKETFEEMRENLRSRFGELLQLRNQAARLADETESKP